VEPAVFDGTNAEYAKDQFEYLPLPSHRSAAGMVTCCWRMSWGELLRVVLTRRIWVQTLTFNNPLQPIRISAIRPTLEN
jgi:hypothetical protein